MKTKALRFLLLTALIFSWLTPSTTAHAASIVVNFLYEIPAVDGNCTLREAIQNANDDALTNADCAAGSSADTITFDTSLSGGTITLQAQLLLSQDVTIDGSSLASPITIGGSGPSSGTSCTFCFRVFYVNSGVTATLNDLRITNGFDDFGGGIANYGTLTVTNSTLSGNAAYQDEPTANQQGGGIYNAGTLTVTHSTVEANNAWYGGGIYNAGTLTVTNSTLSLNFGAIDGGGIYNAGGLTVTNSTLLTNSSTSGFGSGGGIYNAGTLTMTKSTLSGNGAMDGGGIYNAGTLAMTNSTLSGNGAIDGGGIANYGTLTVTNSTLSGNSAHKTAGLGGGGIKQNGGTAILRNTIVANSTLAMGGNCAGTITNGGNNIDEGATCGWGSDSGSMSRIDPLLGPLADNGGPTQTFALLTFSPAIDAGDDATCSAAPVNGLDQRGVTRPQESHCDIGAFELKIYRIYLPLVIR